MIKYPRKWYTWGLAILFLAGCAVIGWLFMATRESGSGAPWYGRGKNLPAMPYRVVIGPMDATSGIRGLVEPGMARKEVEAGLGKPLVTEIPRNNRDLMMDESASSVFYQGVFAWVDYNVEGRVIIITYDLHAFRQTFGGSQQILLSLRGHNYLLGAELTKDEAIKMFRAQGESRGIRVQPDDIVILGTGTALSFTDEGQHLRSVDVIVPENWTGR